eukprot:TRINITY_DN2518_c0_g1_i6.p2 TRINITY_DN2518_c0_g1~~TRINITY_DN2518_c0_g1_i6.p2  ORF type:complete len:141 (-),score=23.89 TRINITY_DN2518_c0_g1_i6:68-490(-)
MFTQKMLFVHQRTEISSGECRKRIFEETRSSTQEYPKKHQKELKNKLKRNKHVPKYKVGVEDEGEAKKEEEGEEEGEEDNQSNNNSRSSNKALDEIWVFVLHNGWISFWCSLFSMQINFVAVSVFKKKKKKKNKIGSAHV